MVNELFQSYQQALTSKNILCIKPPQQKLSVQGGIGTASENEFLLQHYQLDATGWGSPFLLVPEVTNVDEDTLHSLAGADEDDFYLSAASPLGILFNNFKKSTAEALRLKRLENGRPGSPCTKKYLCTNTEFTELPICTASREYQHLKLNQLATLNLTGEEHQRQFNAVTEKVCLCEGLCASAYIKYDMLKPKESSAVAVCPGPNLAYFSGIYTLEQMVRHIYGTTDLLGKISRPHMFIKELSLYIDYLRTDLQEQLNDLTDKKKKQLFKFKLQLQDGISYYKNLFTESIHQAPQVLASLAQELNTCEKELSAIAI